MVNNPEWDKLELYQNKPETICYILLAELGSLNIQLKN